MAKKGDGLANKGDGWPNGDACLSKFGSAPACFGSSLGSNPDISRNFKWATSAKEWPTQNSTPKKYKQKI